MKKAVIFDIDGTLSNPAHRLPLIEGTSKNWSAFYEACDQDTLHEGISRILDECVAGGIAIVLMTGRVESVRAKTEKWLKANGISYDLLLMRRDNEYAKDYELKEIWVRNLSGAYDFIAAYDDMSHNIEMFKRLGIAANLASDGKII